MKILKKRKAQKQYIQCCTECRCELLIDFQDIEDKDQLNFWGKFHCPFCGSLQFLNSSNQSLAQHYKEFGGFKLRNKK